MSKAIERIKATAQALALLRKAISTKEEEQRADLAGMKADRDQKQEELLLMLKKEGLASIKTDELETYTIAHRDVYRFSDPIAEIRIATELKCLVPDRMMMKQHLARMKTLPAGVTVEDAEYISVRKPKPEKVEAEADAA